METDNAYNAIDEAGRTTERKPRKLKEKAIAKGVWNGHGVRPKYKKVRAARDALAGVDEQETEDFLLADQDEEFVSAFEEEASMRWETDSVVVDQYVHAAEITEGEERANILRKKEVDDPMTVEDAVESLQFLGHDFFMFLDKRSEINVVYKRDVAGYGVLPRGSPCSSETKENEVQLVLSSKMDFFYLLPPSFPLRLIARGPWRWRGPAVQPASRRRARAREPRGPAGSRTPPSARSGRLAPPVLSVPPPATPARGAPAAISRPLALPLLPPQTSPSTRSPRSSSSKTKTVVKASSLFFACCSSAPQWKVPMYRYRDPRSVLVTQLSG